MKRSSISLPDDLAEAVDKFLEAQEVRPALTTVLQAALHEYLGARGFMRVRKTTAPAPSPQSRTSKK